MPSNAFVWLPELPDSRSSSSILGRDLNLKKDISLIVFDTVVIICTYIICEQLTEGVYHDNYSRNFLYYSK